MIIFYWQAVHNCEGLPRVNIWCVIWSEPFWQIRPWVVRYFGNLYSWEGSKGCWCMQGCSQGSRPQQNFPTWTRPGNATSLANLLMYISGVAWMIVVYIGWVLFFSLLEMGSYLFSVSSQINLKNKMGKLWNWHNSHRHAFSLRDITIEL